MAEHTTTPVRLTVSTDQEAFDAVVRHLAQLDGRSIADGTCVYNGKKCAIGAIVDDPDLLELLSAGVMSIAELIDHVDIGVVDLDLLEVLQATHDLYTNWDDNKFADWDHLRCIASGYGLSAAVVDEVTS